MNIVNPLPSLGRSGVIGIYLLILKLFILIAVHEVLIRMVAAVFNIQALDNRLLEGPVREIGGELRVVSVLVAVKFICINFEFLLNGIILPGFLNQGEILNLRAAPPGEPGNILCRYRISFPGIAGIFIEPSVQLGAMTGPVDDFIVTFGT